MAVRAACESGLAAWDDPLQARRIDCFPDHWYVTPTPGRRHRCQPAVAGEAFVVSDGGNVTGVSADLSPHDALVAVAGQPKVQNLYPDARFVRAGSLGFEHVGMRMCLN